MKCEPKSITYRVHQSRYVEVTIDADKGYRMPTTLKQVLEWEKDIREKPLTATEEQKLEWVVDENDVQDLEFHEE
jgi:hypothetical protein